MHEGRIDLHVFFKPPDDAFVPAVAEGADQSRRQPTACQDHPQQRLDQRLRQCAQTIAECRLLQVRGDVGQTEVRQSGNERGPRGGGGEEDDAGACDAGCECDCIDFARPAPLSLADADAFMSTYSARRPATRGRCSGLAALAADTQVNQRATNPAC